MTVGVDIPVCPRMVPSERMRLCHSYSRSWNTHSTKGLGSLFLVHGCTVLNETSLHSSERLGEESEKFVRLEIKSLLIQGVDFCERQPLWNSNFPKFRQVYSHFEQFLRSQPLRDKGTRAEIDALSDLPQVVFFSRSKDCNSEYNLLKFDFKNDDFFKIPLTSWCMLMKRMRL